jgi:glycosyltransferase involved in cell wall biosynthesis
MEGRFGGPQARIIAVAKELKHDGIETVAVFPKNNSDFFYRKLTENNVQARRLSLHRLTKQKPHLVKFIAFFVPELFYLYQLFKKEQVDIVHCNGAWQVKGIIAGKLAGAKVVWHLNDTGMPFFIKIMFKFLALNFCDGFIPAGARVKDYYLSDRRFLRKPVMEIQAPVDTSVFDPQKVSPHQEIGCLEGIKIVTVGNINPLKGIEYLIKMASILNGQYNNLNFFVVGSHLANQNEYLERLLRLIKYFKPKNVHFHGSSDSVPSVLRASDIYVCSSISEASPISVWEAMAMAKPIVSTDVGDVARFIKNGETGFVVPTRDAAALAEKVGQLIEDEKLRKSFGAKARDVAIRSLDISICAKKHAEFYGEIIKQGNDGLYSWN